MLYLHRLIRAITYTEKQRRADDSFWGHSKGEQNSWVFYLPAIRASCQSILDRSVFPGWEMFRECVLSQATHWVNCHCIVFMSLVCIFHKLSQHHIAMWKTLQLQCRTCKKKKRRKLCKSVQRVLTLPLSLSLRVVDLIWFAASPIKVSWLIIQTFCLLVLLVPPLYLIIIIEFITIYS